MARRTHCSVNDPPKGCVAAQPASVEAPWRRQDRSTSTRPTGRPRVSSGAWRVNGGRDAIQCIGSTTPSGGEPALERGRADPRSSTAAVLAVEHFDVAEQRTCGLPAVVAASGKLTRRGSEAPPRPMFSHFGGSVRADAQRPAQPWQPRAALECRALHWEGAEL